MDGIAPGPGVIAVYRDVAAVTVLEIAVRIICLVKELGINENGAGALDA